jgi:hypothetical protein
MKASHTIGTPDEWLAARLELPEAERALTHRGTTEDGEAYPATAEGPS